MYYQKVGDVYAGTGIQLNQTSTAVLVRTRVEMSYCYSRSTGWYFIYQAVMVQLHPQL